MTVMDYASSSGAPAADDWQIAHTYTYATYVCISTYIHTLCDNVFVHIRIDSAKRNHYALDSFLSSSRIGIVAIKVLINKGTIGAF